MTNLKRASKELFSRQPDERFESLQSLSEFCQHQKDYGRDRWQLPGSVKPLSGPGRPVLELGNDGAFQMNDWSFTQLCKLSRVSKDTINRLSVETATKAFQETLPKGSKPIQVMSENGIIRSIQGTNYSRLWNAEMLAMVGEFAVDFQPPPKGMNGGTGLYAGEQDMFCFLIDPTGWAEIDGENFCPGFFVWNSEVGRRSLGISTFWFQAICANHIVWDATEIAEFSRNHTGEAKDSLREIRKILDALVHKRDERRDQFVRVMKQAMLSRMGDTADETLKQLQSRGIPAGLAKQAVEMAQTQGRFTIFSLVDALTRLSQEQENAGDRLEVDQKASQLLNLVANEVAVRPQSQSLDSRTSLLVEA